MWIGDGWTIVLDAAVSQPKRSDWGRAAIAPARRVARGDADEAVEVAPDAVGVGARRQRAQARLVELGARGEEAAAPAEDHDAGVERLAALEVGHHAPDRVLEGVTLAARGPPRPRRRTRAARSGARAGA